MLIKGTKWHVKKSDINYNQSWQSHFLTFHTFNTILAVLPYSLRLFLVLVFPWKWPTEQNKTRARVQVSAGYCSALSKWLLVPGHIIEVVGSKDWISLSTRGFQGKSKVKEVENNGNPCENDLNQHWHHNRSSRQQGLDFPVY